MFNPSSPPEGVYDETAYRKVGLLESRADALTRALFAVGIGVLEMEAE